ncbi:MAG: RsmD family RNA methyltransferase [Tannerellaceae bacterium]|jgi:16S rRNA (guanine(966)-N(2))-methyltransferase RsmD|nr:RsmD family RNA methyltransferase [Tannerellaceae bacterium]
MRIISGIYGKRRFSIPPAFNARPTTDFAKENLFNVLSNIIDFDGAVALDLFAGTGSISFELLSRGCTVTAIESERMHTAFIAKVARTLKTDKLNIICGDAFRFMRKPGGRKFDFIFADPPYTLKELPDIPALVLNNDMLKPESLFVLEHSKKYDFSSLPHFQQHRAYGSVNFSFFVKQESTKL